MSTLLKTSETESNDRPAPETALPLGELLSGAKLIERSDLEAALQLQTENGKQIGETLLELGVVSEEQLLPFLEKKLGVASVQLREGLIDPKALRLIPQVFAESENVLALIKVHNVLTVAMADPHNLQQIDEIERVSQLQVKPVFAFASSIQRMIRRVYEDDYSVDAVTADLEDSAVELNEEIESLAVPSLEDLADGSPTINLVNFLIVQALRQGASDVHIEPGRKHTSVRYRVDGQLVETLQPRRSMHPAIVSRIKVMGKLDIAEQRAPQDGRCQVCVEGKEIDLRISTLPTILGEKVVIRILDRSRLTFNLNDLGMSDTLLSQVKKLLARPYGLVLVTGPTGSGKTTTLYSALELIKSEHTNIVTVEDPVEYQLEMINQVQTDNKRSLDFPRALRSMLRQDPDVIMVGEIRDAETAAMAVQAALTGHLVLSTLHTNDAPSAVTRLADMDIAPYKLAAALVGVVAQRLVRRICPNCRSSHYPSAEFLSAIHYEGDMRRSFSRGEGCLECLDTGYKGRTGIYEVMTTSPQLRDLIVQDSNVEEVRRCFRETGGISLLESGIELAEQGLTSLEEVSRIAFYE